MNSAAGAITYGLRSKDALEKKVRALTAAIKKLTAELLDLGEHVEREAKGTTKRRDQLEDELADRCEELIDVAVKSNNADAATNAAIAVLAALVAAVRIKLERNDLLHGACWHCLSLFWCDMRFRDFVEAAGGIGPLLDLFLTTHDKGDEFSTPMGIAFFFDAWTDFEDQEQAHLAESVPLRDVVAESFLGLSDDSWLQSRSAGLMGWMSLNSPQACVFFAEECLGKLEEAFVSFQDEEKTKKGQKADPFVIAPFVLGLAQVRSGSGRDYQDPVSLLNRFVAVFAGAEEGGLLYDNLVFACELTESIYSQNLCDEAAESLSALTTLCVNATAENTDDWGIVDVCGRFVATLTEYRDDNIEDEEVEPVLAALEETEADKFFLCMLSAYHEQDKKGKESELIGPASALWNLGMIERFQDKLLDGGLVETVVKALKTCFDGEALPLQGPSWSLAKNLLGVLNLFSWEALDRETPSEGVTKEFVRCGGLLFLSKHLDDERIADKLPILLRGLKTFDVKQQIEQHAWSRRRYLILDRHDTIALAEREGPHADGAPWYKKRRVQEKDDDDDDDDDDEDERAAAKPAAKPTGKAKTAAAASAGGGGGGGAGTAGGVGTSKKVGGKK